MTPDGRSYALFTRNLRRPGLPLWAFTRVPEARRGDIARALGAVVIFSDVLDMERATADIRGPDGAVVTAPDAPLAAYRLLVERGEAPLKRLRFITPEGEVHVQGEYFRPTDNAQIWREAEAPAITQLDSPDLGPALGPILGVEVRDVLGAALVSPPAGPPVMVVLLRDLKALKAARIGQGARTWLRAQRPELPTALPWALHSQEATSPLFDGHIRLLEGAGPVEGRASSAALVAHWARTPKHMAFNAEIGDGETVFGQVATWVEGLPEAPERLSIGGHVFAGEPAPPGLLGLDAP